TASLLWLKAPMLVPRLVSLLALVLLPVSPEMALLTPALLPSPPQSPASGPLIYLSDFELPAVPPRRPSDPNGPLTQDQEPSEQAQRILTFLKLNLTEALQKAGFSVASFPPPSGRPDHGILLRGVFTEPDEYNRVRRVLMGSASPSATFVLYVALSNLARPHQPLYQLVPLDAPWLTVA